MKCQYRQGIMVVLALCAVFFFPKSSQAQKEIKTEEVKGILVENGVARPLDEKELEQVKKEQMKASVPADKEQESVVGTRSNWFCNMTFWSKFTKKRDGKIFLNHANKVVLTASARGPATIHSQTTRTFYASSNLSLRELRSLGVHIRESAVLKTSSQNTFPIPEEKIEHLTFTPKYRRIYGEVEDYFHNTLLRTRKVVIEEPVVMGESCDGLLKLELEK